ncbi:MFS transporter [Sulfurisphaera javensis]|uniref:MFS transporter n=1 Tax=Sulfurisphaera javensis TaxID=2049879 RepID=A0AAT9GQQ4_9CREN
MNRQFILFTILVFFTGFYLGILRITIPEYEKELNLGLSLALLLPLVAFGFVKGTFNFLAGKLSDDLGRKKVLLIGWIIALLSSFLVFYLNVFAIIVVSILLGINQALTWTTTVTSQIDISGKRRAGFATGINEMSGYLGVSFGSFLASIMFNLNYIFILSVSVIALLGSMIAMETKKLVNSNTDPKLRYYPITKISIAGLLEKFVDSAFFILIPSYLLLQHYSLYLVGLTVSSYAFSWSLSQPLFGYIADAYNKRRLILALGFVLMFLGFMKYSALPLEFSIIEGLGMGMIYPNLIAAVNDRVDESVRGKALGYYRLYRDSGYGVAGLILPLIYSIVGFNYTLFIIGLFQLVAMILIL